MRILQINAVYGTGSTGRIVQDISKALTEQGHEVYVFWAIGCKEDRYARFVRIGNTFDHKIHALLRRIDGRQGWHSKRATQRACQEILRIAPDVVHLHNLHSNYIHLPTLLDFLAEHDIPTLITLHDCWMFTAGFCTYYHYFFCSEWKTGCKDCPAVSAARQRAAVDMYQTKESLYKKMQHLAVNGVSKWTAEAAKCSMLKNAKSIRCIYNWVDTELFRPRNNAVEIRKKYGIPQEYKLILGVSQGWSAEKGLDEFVLAADALKDSASIILVGKDQGVPKRENLQCIGFTNNRQELVDLYSAADLLLNPSKAETFGLVTAEAMACGTPVVAYDNSGTSELVAAQCGALAPDGDSSKLLEEVKTVLNIGKQAYANACRQWVYENFDKDNQVQKYMDCYLQMIATRSE